MMFPLASLQQTAAMAPACTRDERVAIVTAIARMRRNLTGHAIKQQFRDADSDGSGCLDLAEIKAMFRKLVLEVRPPSLPRPSLPALHPRIRRHSHRCRYRRGTR